MGKPFQGRYTQPLQATALLFSAAVMATGIGCGYLAWTQESLSFGVTCVVLLLAAPPLAVLALLAANSVPGPSDSVSANTLIDGMHRANTTLWMIRKARAHVGVAAASTFVVWVCEAFGLIDAQDFALCLTFLVSIAAAGYLPWLARQERLIRAQRDGCRSRLNEISVEQNWFAG